MKKTGIPDHADRLKTAAEAKRALLERANAARKPSGPAAPGK